MTEPIATRFYDERIRLEDVPDAIAAMRKRLRIDRKAFVARIQLLGIGLLVGGVVPWPWIVHFEEGMWLPAGALAIGAVILGIYCIKPDTSPAGPPRLVGKIDYVEELFDALGSELNPRARIALRVDLGMYEEYTKLTRQVQSGGGRTKHYYSDRWLRLAVRLADGSTVRIVRHMGTKSKAGRGTQRERRRLSLQLRPNRRLYRPIDDPRPLVEALTGAVRRIFDNTPEGFEAKVRPNGDDLAIKVFQDDTEISAKETIELLSTALQNLQAGRIPRGAYR